MVPFCDMALIVAAFCHAATKLAAWMQRRLEVKTGIKLHAQVHTRTHALHTCCVRTQTFTHTVARSLLTRIAAAVGTGAAGATVFDAAVGVALPSELRYSIIYPW